MVNQLNLDEGLAKNKINLNFCFCLKLVAVISVVLVSFRK